MNIGIDARPLISKKPSGIGIYLRNILYSKAFTTSQNTFFLFSNKSIDSDLKFPSNFVTVIIPGRIGSLWLRFKLPKYLNKYEISVFWGTQHLLPKKAKNVKYVLTVHDLALLINPKWGEPFNALIQNTLGKASFKEADQILCDSNATKNDLIKFINVPPSKCHTVYLSFQKDKTVKSDSQSVKPLTKFNLNKFKYFMFVGNIEPRKNIKNLICFFDDFINKNRDAKDYKLIIGGNQTKKSKSIIKSYKKIKNKSNILIEGYFTPLEKEELMENSLAFIFPSYYEGFGIPVLEAMNSGTIVITSSTSSLPEVGGDAALYIKNLENYKSYEEAFRRCINMTETERSDLIARGKANLKRFDWGKTAKDTFDVIVGEYKSE